MFHCSAVESVVVVVASSCSASAKPQAMSREMTRPKNVTWNQHAPKVLKSSCAVDNHLTLEQLSNNECHCNPDERDLQQGCLSSRKGRETSCKFPDLEKRQRFVRQFVFSTENGRKLQNSRLLRFCFKCGKRSDDNTR